MTPFELPWTVLMLKCSEFAAVEAKCTIGWLEEGEFTAAEACG